MRKATIMMMGVLLFSSLILAQSDYKIGAQDVLEISVVGLQEYPVTARVTEDGKITIPLLREVEVGGFSTSELERKLAELLEERFLQNPQVSVFIREFQSKLVFVTGAVINQGPLELIGNQRLMQVISRAGGLGPDAGEEIIVIRTLPDGNTRTIRISIEDLFVRGDADLNIPLRPDDSINVLVDKIVHVYVMGRVNTPGRLEIKISDLAGFTLLKAIAQAGGFAERAAKGSVKIKRKGPDGKEEEIEVNCKDIIKGKKPDILLKEDDWIYIPETIF
jgi:polysaccharide export outer membrane protein